MDNIEELGFIFGLICGKSAYQNQSKNKLHTVEVQKSNSWRSPHSFDTRPSNKKYRLIYLQKINNHFQGCQLA